MIMTQQEQLNDCLRAMQCEEAGSLGASSCAPRRAAMAVFALFKARPFGCLGNALLFSSQC